MFDQSKNKDTPLFLFIIDIDKFKLINDTYGHAVGDKVIKGFAESVKKHLTKIGCFARLGGDEFAAVLTGMSKDQARQQIEQLRTYIAETNIISNQDILFTISIGMAELQSKDRDIDELLARADYNLYEAKKTRNTLVG
jgi:diguanylate cyclase (GGDEF)-like protein